jgi:hypothetical protein
MYITAFISIVCFNFNKVLNMVLTLICDNMYDDVVPVFGPYMNMTPIVIEYAVVDNVECTNKLKLLTNWYWNSDIGGILTSNILLKGEKIAIQYKKKYSENQPDKTNICIINIKKNKVTIENKTKNILFEELKII